MEIRKIHDRGCIYIPASIGRLRTHFGTVSQSLAKRTAKDSHTVKK